MEMTGAGGEGIGGAFYNNGGAAVFTYCTVASNIAVGGAGNADWAVSLWWHLRHQPLVR